MKKKNWIFPLVLVLFVGSFFLLLNLGQQETTGGSNTREKEKVSEVTNAEKIEVIHFHATQQCWACITLGEYTLKAIEQEFPKEYEEGTITFQDLNVDSAENREIASKYQARGSSLFINAIVDGEDNIQEDITVWRLLGSEERFIEYLSDKLSSMLGA